MAVTTRSQVQGFRELDRVVKALPCRLAERELGNAVLAGALEGDVDELQRQVKYILPKWEYVNPLQDRQAEKVAVDELWKSRSDVIEAEGTDPLDSDQRIAADQEREDRLSLRRGGQAQGAKMPAWDAAGVRALPAASSSGASRSVAAAA